MTLLDVITPVPKTLIKDDERRKGVNRGILIAAVLMLAFLFIFWKRSPASVHVGTDKYVFICSAMTCAL